MLPEKKQNEKSLTKQSEKSLRRTKQTKFTNIGPDSFTQKRIRKQDQAFVRISLQNFKS